jgi:hypothetical protein
MQAMKTKTPRTRRQPAETHQPPVEDDNSPEALIISSLMDAIPTRRRRLETASAIFRAIEIGAIPGIYFEY